MLDHYGKTDITKLNYILTWPMYDIIKSGTNAKSIRKCKVDHWIFCVIEDRQLMYIVLESPILGTFKKLPFVKFCHVSRVLTTTWKVLENLSASLVKFPKMSVSITLFINFLSWTNNSYLYKMFMFTYNRFFVSELIHVFSVPIFNTVTIHRCNS